MEKVYKGRAVVERTSRGLSVEISSHKQWAVIVFLTVWLCGWSFGGLFAVRQVIGDFKNEIDFSSFFLLFWLCGWAFGLFTVIKIISTMFFGKEIIRFNRDVIEIQRKGGIIPSHKTYDLKEVKSFTINTSGADSINTNKGVRHKNSLNGFNIAAGGVFKFAYGMKTLYIGAGLDEAEGKKILEKLISQGLLSDKHLQ